MKRSGDDNNTVVTLTQNMLVRRRRYGSVTSMDIAAQLKNLGIDIDRRKILLTANRLL
jgi:ribosomal protein L9